MPDPTPVADAAVRLEGLSVRTQGKDARLLVEGVDLTVAPGEVCGIVGETGAGKSLTMRALLGLLAPGLRAEGRAWLGGREIDPGSPAKQRRELLGRDMGIVTQNPAGMLDPVVKVGRQLIEGVVRRRMLPEQQAVERARELLSFVGFAAPDQIWELYPHQLSGGMSQRVGIAMAMMPRPRVLVVDEPTSALDAQLRSEVLRVIRTLATDYGTAVLLISHDLGLVGDFCDRVAVMYAGRPVELGSADDVLRHPAHPYSIALRDVSPSLDAELRARLRVIPGAPPQPGRWPGGCVFEPRCPRRQDVCAARRPALEPRDGRTVACFFPGDEGKDSA